MKNKFITLSKSEMVRKWNRNSIEECFEYLKKNCKEENDLDKFIEDFREVYEKIEIDEHIIEIEKHRKDILKGIVIGGTSVAASLGIFKLLKYIKR